MVATCLNRPEVAVLLEVTAPGLSLGIGNCRNLSLRWRKGSANRLLTCVDVGLCAETSPSARHAARVDVGLCAGWIADFGAGFGTGRITMLGVGVGLGTDKTAAKGLDVGLATDCIALLGSDVGLTTGMNAALGFSAGLGTCKMVALCLDTSFGIGRIASVLSFAAAWALAKAFVTNIDCPEDQLPRKHPPGNMWEKRWFGHSPHAALPTCG